MPTESKSRISARSRPVSRDPATPGRHRGLTSIHIENCCLSRRCLALEEAAHYPTHTGMCSLPVRRVPSKHWPILGCQEWLRMDGTKLFSPFDQARRSRPTAACPIAPNPQPINAVAVHFCRLGAPMYVHEKVALSAVAESIARLSGYKYAGIFDANKHSTANLFFVPDDTLMLDEAGNLGISSPRQLYGAVVPYPFAKTKAITHRLINTLAARPCGWSTAFTENVSGVVLPGYTTFNADDARSATARLLSLGRVRIKEPLRDGGHGQKVVSTT